MSVIGRLDDQVSEILITPLQKKKRQETNEQADEKASSHEAAQIEPNSSEDKRAERETLPVWLL